MTRVKMIMVIIMMKIIITLVTGGKLKANKTNK